MSNTQKPPMVVWLNHSRPPFLSTSTERSQITPDGPYVHLDQFLDAVESVADGKHQVTMRQYASDFLEACQEFCKEIKDQK